MDKAAILLCKSNKFQGTGLGKFAKDVLVQGVYIHPTTGKTVDLSDPKRLERLAANTSAYRKNGNKVPFPDGHTFDAMKNLGDWDPDFIVKDGRLWGMVNPKAPGVEERLAAGSIDGVSAYIEFNVTDSKGTKYDEVITHICATDYPVVGGQHKFIPLSKVGDQEVAIFLSKDLTGMSPEDDHKEARMLKNIALALGLAEAATEAEVLGALKTQGDDRKGLAEKVKTFEGLSAVKPDELKAHGLELVGGKLSKISDTPETPREKAMREQLDVLQLDRAKEKLSAAKSKAEALMKSGVVPKPIAEKLSKLFAIKDKVESLALSADGKTLTGEAVDVEGILNELLGGIKGIAGSRLSVLKVAEGEPKEKSGDDLRKEGAALARKVQGLPEDKKTA